MPVGTWNYENQAGVSTAVVGQADYRKIPLTPASCFTCQEDVAVSWYQEHTKVIQKGRGPSFLYSLCMCSWWYPIHISLCTSHTLPIITKGSSHLTRIQGQSLAVVVIQNCSPARVQGVKVQSPSATDNNKHVHTVHTTLHVWR